MCSSAFGANPWHSLMLAITPATKVPWPKPMTGRRKQNKTLEDKPSHCPRFVRSTHPTQKKKKSHQSNRLYNKLQTLGSVLVFLYHILLLCSVGSEFPVCVATQSADETPSDKLSSLSTPDCYQ